MLHCCFIQYILKAFLKSQEYLFKMATPDAIARSKYSGLFTKWKEVYEMYFRIHSYSYLDDFINKQLGDNSDRGIVIQIATHSALLQRKNVLLLQKSLGFVQDQIALLTLQQFNTAADFCNRVR